MAFDRSAALSWYSRNRERSRSLFDMLPEDVYYSRPIDLRHPIVFYDGHLPGFSFNVLVKKALGRPSIDARLEPLFARGIDPQETTAGPKGPALRSPWPARVEGVAAPAEWIEMPAGCATLGVARASHAFGWDNEHPALSAQVPAFSIE